MGKIQFQGSKGMIVFFLIFFFFPSEFMRSELTLLRRDFVIFLGSIVEQALNFSFV